MARQKTPIRPRGILAAGQLTRHAPVAAQAAVERLAVTLAQHIWPAIAEVAVSVEVSEDGGKTWTPAFGFIAAKGSGLNPLGGPASPDSRAEVARPVDPATGLTPPLFKSANPLRRVRVVTLPSEAVDTAIDLEQV